jgi:hypothetical protein
MNRIEIEIKLSRDRAWLLETYAAMPREDLERGLTPSEHDPATLWSAKDHLIHLAGIEKMFNRMVERQLAGDANPVGLLTHPDGAPRPREEMMASIHAMNDAWVHTHRAKSLSEVVALGEEVRAETFALLARLSDAQLESKLAGAPWADGTIGAVLSVNADHARRHAAWVKEGFAAKATT